MCTWQPGNQSISYIHCFFARIHACVRFGSVNSHRGENSNAAHDDDRHHKLSVSGAACSTAAETKYTEQRRVPDSHVIVNRTKVCQIGTEDFYGTSKIGG